MKIQHTDYKLRTRQILLILIDMMIVVAASFFALLLRFDFQFETIEPLFLSSMYLALPFQIVWTWIAFWLLRMYHSLWEYASIQEFLMIAVAGLASVSMLLLLTVMLKLALPRSFYLLYYIILVGLVAMVRIVYRYIRRIKHSHASQNRSASAKNIMIIGAGEAGTTLIREIQSKDFLNYKICCALDGDKNKHGTLIRGVPIVGDRNDIISCVKTYKIDMIFIALPRLSAKELKPILDICQQTGCEIKKIPAIYQLMNGDVTVEALKSIGIEELLGRDPIQIDLDSILGYVQNKVVLVTGGGGSIGSEICQQIASHSPKQLIILDIYENTTYTLQQELLRNHPDLDLVVLIASVRDYNRLRDIFEKYRPDIVYHAAAHKHVPLMETSPNEAIKNNVMGTYNMVRVADETGVKRFIQISTDKAVNPTNIMGASKRICEMIIQAYDKRSKTEYVAVRFGNVLGSNGSVVPLFEKQIAEGGPVTVTHPDIIRYFMTIPEAVSLVLQAGAFAKGGEIFVLDMGEPVRILDLARNMIRLTGMKEGEDIDIVFTGLRPGEKLYEELLMDEEGLQKTANQKIFIGRPIDVSDEDLFAELDHMRTLVDDESEDLRTIVKRIVPTYQIPV